MKRRVAIAMVILGWSWGPSMAWAQTTWQELETMIRQQRPSGTVAEPPLAERQPESTPAERAYLGILADDRADRGRGVRIVRVTPDSPAQKAGLKVDDLITELADVRVRAMTDLAAILQQAAPDSTLVFEVLRDNRRYQIPVTFGRRPTVAGATDPAIEAIETPSPKSDAPAENPMGQREDPLIHLQRRLEELEKRVEQLERVLAEKK